MMQNITYTASPIFLLSVAALSIVALLLLIIKCRVNAFVALILVSFCTAVIAGIPSEEVVPTLMSGFGGTHQHQRLANPAGAIKRNTMVYVSGLQSAHQHNGKTGKVLKFDETKERYTIELDNGSTRLGLKQSNITQIVKNIIVTGIESRPEFNGQHGTIRGWQSDSGRYAVQLNSGQAMGLLPAKVRLPMGTRVTLQGLSSEQHNGVRGEILRYDAEHGRYIVKTAPSGSNLKVKLENVKV